MTLAHHVKKAKLFLISRLKKLTLMDVFWIGIGLFALFFIIGLYGNR